MAAPDTSSILLGSGELFGMAYDPVAGFPADVAFEAVDNSFGDISGGASLEYKPTEYEVSNDAGVVRKRFVTKEEVTFKSGVLTWLLDNLTKLSPGVLTTNGNVKTITLGGAKALTAYALRFVHTKADGLKVRVTLVGTAGNGFTLTFDGSKETVIDAEFKALAQATGTLVTISEEMPAAGDVTAPVLTIVPANAAVGVAVTASVVFTFDDSILASDITAEHFAVYNDVTNALIPGALTRTTDKIVTYKSTANLAATTKFRVVCDGVKNTKGLMVASTTTVFTTA